MRQRLVAAKLAATCVSSLLVIITIAWPKWVELVFGSDPDGGNGLLEALIVVVLVAAAVASSLAARVELRRNGLAKLSGTR